LKQIQIFDAGQTLLFKQRFQILLKTREISPRISRELSRGVHELRHITWQGSWSHDHEHQVQSCIFAQMKTNTF